MKILVVDDEFAVARLMGYILVNAGYSPEIALGGQEAVRRLKATPRDYILVISDLHMVSIGARKIASTIFEDPSLRGMPIIVVSGDRDLELIFKADERFNGYIAKPWQRQEVLELVRDVIGPPKESAVACFICGHPMVANDEEPVPERKQQLRRLTAHNVAMHPP